MNGFYSQANKRIKQLKNNGEVIIDRDNLLGWLDFSSLSREELEEYLDKAINSLMLYQNNFRSVVRGKCVYVDYVAIKNRHVIQKLIQNATKSEEEKLAMVKILESLEAKAEDSESGQMAFDSDDDNNILFYQEMDREELIELLKNLTAETGS